MNFIIRACCLFVFIAQCYADDATTSLSGDTLNRSIQTEFNLLFGISAFDGALGLEIVNQNHSFGIALPGRMSYRYYFNPSQDTKFWGIYFGGYSANDINHKVDGIQFSERSSSYIGAGIGYRWQWPSGWNVNASIAFEYSDDEYSNPGSTLTASETGLYPFPGINVAYKF